MITLNDCRVPIYSGKSNAIIKDFVGSFIYDRGILKNKRKLFYSESDKQIESTFKVLNLKRFKNFKHNEWEKIQVQWDGGVTSDIFGKQAFDLLLPVNTNTGEKISDITDNVIKFFFGPLARARIIDDLYFTLCKLIIRSLGVYYDFEKNKIGFGIKPRKKYNISGGKVINFKSNTYSLEGVLKAEIKQGFVNKTIGDENRGYGYTHLLREHAKFELTNWGKKVLVNWNKYNIIATSRGTGKTYLGALIVARALLDERPGFGGRAYREIKLFVPDKENIGNQFMEYVKSFIGDLIYIKLDNGKKAFEFKGNNYIKCNITGNIFKLISLYRFGQGGLLGNATGEGLACDVAIIDEAARIPSEFWISFHQRAAFETSEFYIASTINEETTTDHWFYDLLVRGEYGEENISSHRVTLEENEIMMKNKTKKEFKEQVEMIKEDLKKKGDKEFYARAFCIILEESNVFQLSGGIIAGNTDKYSNEDFRILGFDLGKLDDTAGLTLVNLNHTEIESSIKVNNLTYGAQLEYAKEYKDKYPNILVIGDRSGVGEAVSEQDLHGTVDTWIKSTGQGNMNYNKKLGYYTASKSMIVNTLANVINNNIIKIPGYNVDLIDQLSSFIKKRSGRGEVILYQGKGKHKDDLVLSTAYAIFYMYHILGLKTEDDLKNYTTTTGNTSTYYYNDNSNIKNDGYYNRFY